MSAFVIKRGLTAFDGLPDGVQQHVVAKWFREKLDGARLIPSPYDGDSLGDSPTRR